MPSDEELFYEWQRDHVTSLEIGVEVVAEDLISREEHKIASSYVIYVALDEKRKPTQVPPLIAANDEEAAIIERALRDRERRKNGRAKPSKSAH